MYSLAVFLPYFRNEKYFPYSSMLRLVRAARELYWLPRCLTLNSRRALCLFMTPRVATILSKLGHNQ